MERIQSINPDRLAWCCADRGVTVDECASEVGIPTANLSKVLAGEPGLTFNQLRKLADYFGRGVLFFLEPEQVDATQVHSPQFRTLANQKPELSARVKALIERVERQRAIYLNLREELDEAELPRYSPPDLTKLNAVEAARKVRQWLGLADTNNFDSYRSAVEAKGLLVFRSNGYSGEWQIAKESPILGFSLFDPACPVIVVKKQSADPQQTFTLMHELGHVLGLMHTHDTAFGAELVDGGLRWAPDPRTGRGVPADVLKRWLHDERVSFGVATWRVLDLVMRELGRWQREEQHTGPGVTPVAPRLRIPRGRALAEVLGLTVSGRGGAEAVRRANAAAAIKVTRRGPATAPRSGEVDAFLASLAG